MQLSKMKNIIVLKGMASNVVDEAIVVLKPNVKIKQSEYNTKGKRNLADVCVTSEPRYFIESKEVRRMVEVFAFLIIGLMISLTINVALLCIIYIQWVNKQI